MSQAPKFAAIVLAAGSSTRMGQTKQLLRLDDSTTLLASVVRTIRSAQISEIVIVLGHNADEIARTLDSQAARIVLNPNHAAGLSSSLQAGLAALAPATAAFIALADQPYVRAKTYLALRDAYIRTPAPIVVPTHNGVRGNPALLARSIFPELMKLEGDVGARAIFARHADEVLKVPVDDPGILIDFDTPEDLAAHGITAPRPPRTDK